jgi:DNA modification methylase
MESNIEWQNLKIPQKKNMFMKYIEDELEKNQKKHENDIIDDLTYTKNIFFLKTLKNDKTRYKKLEKDDIIIKNNIIIKINDIKINDSGLIYFFDDKLKQSKITDYNKYRNNNNSKIIIESKTKYYKPDDDGKPVFLIP